MKTFRKIALLQKFLDRERKNGKTIGFVPTLGFLHQGHLSLVRAAQKENEVVIVSIFVNPTQFGPKEDFEKYPRDLKRDQKLLRATQVDFLFCPGVSEIYPSSLKPAKITPPKHLADCLCGISRPHHFSGVCQVVKRLFEIVRPDRVYFGQKDYQQALIVQWLAGKFFPKIEIKICPTVREKDGLAMSSRNVYLNKKERKAASIIPEVLRSTRRLFEKGERNPIKIRAEISHLISREKLAKVDYVEIRDAANLHEVEMIDQKVVVAVAVLIGKTRLLDNVLL